MEDGEKPWGKKKFDGAKGNVKKGGGDKSDSRTKDKAYSGKKGR
jgi:hypothetical protein